MSKAYLIDTHILIWWLEDNPKLSVNIKKILLKAPVLVSTATLWEISIKQSIGKLKMEEDYFQYVEEAGFEILDVKTKHTLMVKELPLIHKDPFDRLLVSQAIAEGLTLITADQALSQYDLKTLVAWKTNSRLDLLND